MKRHGSRDRSTWRHDQSARLAALDEFKNGQIPLWLRLMLLHAALISPVLAMCLILTFHLTQKIMCTVSGAPAVPVAMAMPR